MTDEDLDEDRLYINKDKNNSDSSTKNIPSTPTVTRTLPKNQSYNSSVKSSEHEEPEQILGGTLANRGLNGRIDNMFYIQPQCEDMEFEQLIGGLST